MRPPAPWRHRLHEIVFEADTPAGRFFDVVLLWSILASVLAVVLESVDGVRAAAGGALRMAEWLFTVLFTLEYALRLACVRQPWRYAVSFYGLVDLLAVLPTFLSLFVPGTQSLLVIRALRLLRVFRVLKLARHLDEARELVAALKNSRHKITVFVGSIATIVLVFGTVMYLVEGQDNGFTSIPRSMYWAVVTMTTVGYGDIAPKTPIGQAIAALVMVVGYAIIAVPTGIVSAELVSAQRRHVSTQACPDCSAEGHDTDAVHCKYCGGRL